MVKLTSEEEKELTQFIKDWLKVHGYSQKDLATNLNINSSRTSEIIKKIKELHKKGGLFNIAKKLIEIEQKWINKSGSIKNIKIKSEINNQESHSEKSSKSYSQLDIDYKVDIDLLINKMEEDFND
tara:strand:- start:253 stop:630 length:378 start_codon:yes stop_codon:yes gene_type:complete